MPKLTNVKDSCRQDRIPQYNALAAQNWQTYRTYVQAICQAIAVGDDSAVFRMRPWAVRAWNRSHAFKRFACGEGYCIAQGYPVGHAYLVTESGPWVEQNCGHTLYKSGDAEAALARDIRACGRARPRVSRGSPALVATSRVPRRVPPSVGPRRRRPTLLSPPVSRPGRARFRRRAMRGFGAEENSKPPIVPALLLLAFAIGATWWARDVKVPR